MSVSALYLHIPFCHAKCAYCDFDSCGLTGAALDNAIASYIPVLLERIDTFGCAGALDHVETVYVGGGTPSVLGSTLVDVVTRVRTWCDPIEVTCEVNPESFNSRLAEGLARSGVTRISCGVQSLHDDELARIGRLHTRAEALDALRCARETGLDVSCDLMCGLPGQTSASWLDTLQGIIAENPCHVSVYPLTLEAGTPLARWAERDASLVPDEDVQADCMEVAEQQLGRAGYARYEVASYAQPGHACLHNQAYWTGRSYMGIGRSAAGMVSREEARRLGALLCGLQEQLDASPEAVRVRFVQLDDAATRFEYELLSARETAAEDLMLGMRRSCGIRSSALTQAAQVIGKDAVDEAVRTACRRGLARWEMNGSDTGRASRLVPTEQGWLLGNELYGLMWDLADSA